MKGAIFDVDGTLLNSMGAWWDVIIKFFKNNGLELTDEKAAGYKEMRLEDSVPSIIAEYGLDMTVDEVIGEFQRMMVKEYEENIPLKKGAAQYLKKLHDEGIKIAIATSGYEELCKSAFTRLSVWQYIDAKAYSHEVGVDKSNPDIYLLAAKRLGVEPCECVVFEDIVLGIGGAKKGGFKTCAVMDITNIDETEKLKKIADNYIEDFTELL